MTAAGVRDKVRALLVAQLGVRLEEITPDAGIVDDLGADSLDCIELAMAAEEEFKIDIPDEDILDTARVCDFERLILRKLNHA